MFCFRSLKNHEYSKKSYFILCKNEIKIADIHFYRGFIFKAMKTSKNNISYEKKKKKKIDYKSNVWNQNSKAVFQRCLSILMNSYKACH